MPKAKITKEQLDQMLANAISQAKAWKNYAKEVKDYVVGVQNKTVPPGTPPPKPPGTK